MKENLKKNLIMRKFMNKDVHLGAFMGPFSVWFWFKTGLSSSVSCLTLLNVMMFNTRRNFGRVKVYSNRLLRTLVVHMISSAAIVIRR